MHRRDSLMGTVGLTAVAGRAAAAAPPMARVVVVAAPDRRDGLRRALRRLARRG